MSKFDQFHVLFCLVWLGQVWFGLVWFYLVGFVSHSMLWFVIVCFGMVCVGLVSYGIREGGREHATIFCDIFFNKQERKKDIMRETPQR